MWPQASDSFFKGWLSHSNRKWQAVDKCRIIIIIIISIDRKWYLFYKILNFCKILKFPKKGSDSPDIYRFLQTCSVPTEPFSASLGCVGFQSILHFGGLFCKGPPSVEEGVLSLSTNYAKILFYVLLVFFPIWENLSVPI